MEKQKLVNAIVIIAVLAIPIMYSFFYLKAYWDPYGNLKDIKIAMVNQDNGYEGENQGQKLINSMKENGTFTICEIEEKEAEAGLKKGNYYAVIKIPNKFSEDLNSANQEEKQISKIIYSPNQKTNYLASQIINSAIKTMEINLQAQVTQNITEGLSTKLNEVPNSLTKISDGTGELLDGSEKLSDGVSSLNSGTQELKSGTSTAYQGSLKIKSEIENSIEKMKNDNTRALNDETLKSIGEQAKQSANNQIKDQTENIGAQAVATVNNEIANQVISIGAQAAVTADNQITAQADSIGKQASIVAEQIIEGKKVEIGESAKDLAIQTITKNSDEIRLEASNIALDKFNNSYLDSTIAMAKEGVLNDLSTSEKSTQIKYLINQSLSNNPNYVLLDENDKNYIVEVEFQIINQIAGDIAQNVSKDVALKTTKLVAEEVSEQTAKKIAEEVAIQTAQIVAEQTAGQVAEQTAQNVSKQVTNQVANQTAQSVAKQVASQVANQTAQTVAEQTAGQVAEQTAQNVADQVANQVKQTALNTVANQMEPLKDGVNSLSLGLERIDAGTGELMFGVSKLYDGSKVLVDGVDILKTSVDEGNTNTQNELKKLEGLSEFASNPIEIDEEAYGKISQYGLSFTPLFLSIGLWVGSLMLYVVLYYDKDNRFKLLDKNAENKFLQIGLYFLLAIAQGIITGFLLKVGLKLEVTNTLLYYFTCTLLATVFLSIIQFLIMNFGDVGKFLGLIILVLQLAASGGTFPIETVSKGFQKLNPFLPMTYAIKLVKETVVMKDKGFAIKNILILSLYLIIPLVCTLIIQYLKNNKETKKVNN